jgi:hypothetical protein
METHGKTYCPLVPACSIVSFIPEVFWWRYHLRRELDAVVPHVRVCGGGARVTALPTPIGVSDFDVHNSCRPKSEFPRSSAQPFWHCKKAPYHAREYYPLHAWMQGFRMLTLYDYFANGMRAESLISITLDDAMRVSEVGRLRTACALSPTALSLPQRVFSMIFIS